MLPVRIVVQARMSSSRLPAKSLLPIGGLPLAILAVKRAGRTGGDVVLATSADASDDILASTAESYKLEVIRGPLDDVLGRYVEATADMAEDGIVVRLTGDNVFPDADLLERIVTRLISGGGEFCEVVWPDDGLPYGVAAQAFYVRTLRLAAQVTTAAIDRENVGRWIRQTRPKVALGQTPGLSDMSALRATVDTPLDYERISRLFNQVDDPVGVSWTELCRLLGQQSDAPIHRVPSRMVAGIRQSRMVLGTAQLGMPYGAANRAGQPSRRAARYIVLKAVEAGVTHLDTARAYGVSESIIGEVLERESSGRATVVTKLNPLEDLPDDAVPGTVVNAVDASIFRSCRELRMSCLPVVLLHRAAHYRRWRGAAWRRLLELRGEGAIGRLGVSVTTPDELAKVIDDPDVVHVQLPINLLDMRWRNAGMPERLHARSDLVVHGRSCFLQGLLASTMLEGWPAVPGVDVKGLVGTLASLASQLGRDGPADLCIGYVLSLDWVDAVATGVDDLAQLTRNLASFTIPPLSADAIERVDASMPLVPEVLLDPGKWQAAAA